MVPSSPAGRTSWDDCNDALQLLFQHFGQTSPKIRSNSPRNVVFLSTSGGLLPGGLLCARPRALHGAAHPLELAGEPAFGHRTGAAGAAAQLVVSSATRRQDDRAGRRAGRSNPVAGLVNWNVWKRCFCP